MRRTHWMLAVLACVLAGSLSHVSAQRQDRQRPIKSYRLVPKPASELRGGKAAFVKGRATAAGDRFVLDDLSILQPVVVSVRTDAQDDDVRLQLSKYRFETTDRQASTKGAGVATLRARTQGEMKILVSGASSTPYYLMVWTGDEVKADMKPVVVRDRSAAQPGSSRMTILMAVAAGVLAAGAAFVVLRRRRA